MSFSVLYFIGYLFFAHWLASILIGLLSFGYPRIRAIKLRNQRILELREQFKQFLFSLSSSFVAGKSFENAVFEASRDLKNYHITRNPYMSDELNYMLARMRNGEPVELVFQRFSKRSQIDEIKQFAEVLTICVTTGSNIIDIVRKTSQVLNERMEIEHDIAISIAQKKWEARLLSCMPFLIVAIMKISSSDYMEPLYHGTGRIIMFICLILLVACVYIINKMIDIKV